MADEPAEIPQRWTAKRRAALIVSILKGETSAPAAARKHVLTVAEIEEWRERFLLGAENALRTRPKDEDALTESTSRSSSRRWASWCSTWTSGRRPRRIALFPRGRPTSE